MPILPRNNTGTTATTTILDHALATAVNLIVSTKAVTNGSSNNNGTIGNDDTGHIANDTVSRGTIFGLFLTLSFCVLSQPYGSLIYRWHCGIFWRLNPLACFMEATVIFSILSATVVDTLRRQPLTFFSRKHLRELWAELHTISAALLIMRANVDRNANEDSMVLLLEAAFDEDTPQPLVSQSPANVEGAIELRSVPQTSGKSAHETQSTVALSVRTEGVRNNQQSIVPTEEEGTQQPDPEEARPANVVNNIEPGSPISSTSGTSAREAHPTVTSATRPPTDIAGITQQRTPRMEEGIQVPEPEPAPDQTQALSASRLSILHNAIGSSGFSQQQFRIQIVLFFAASGGAVKLCAMRSIPHSLRVAGAFMLAAWLGVQVLLLIFHSRRIDDKNMARIVHHTRSLTEPTKSRVYTLSLKVSALLVFPLLFYLSIIYCFMSMDPRNYFLVYSGLGPFFFVFFLVHLLLLWILSRFWDLVFRTGRLKIFFTVQAISGGVLGVPYAYTFIYHAGVSLFDETNSSALGILVRSYYYVALAAYIGLFVFFATGLLLSNTTISLYSTEIPSRTTNKCGTVDPVGTCFDNYQRCENYKLCVLFLFCVTLHYQRSLRPGVLNVLITAWAFALFLIGYDPSGTHQPAGWVGWLG